MPLTRRKRRVMTPVAKQWWPLRDIRKGTLPAKWHAPPAPVKADRGPRDTSVPDCEPDYYATPEQVAADQRAAVAEAVRACGPLTAEELSGVVGLAPDVVRRRLDEIERGE